MSQDRSTSNPSGLQLLDSLDKLQIMSLHDSQDIREKLERYHPKLNPETWSVLQARFGQVIKGTDLFRLRPQHFTVSGITEEEQQILFSLTSRKASENYKIFLDPVYGDIKLHPLLVHIIDSPEMQRLRNIKQLGGAYWVLPGASHNRFEHSIGACYLAGEVGKTLQNKNPDYISDRDILCLQIAALCHELGQGPFSRLFDRYVVPRVLQRPDGGDKSKHWVRQTSAKWVAQFLKSDGIKDHLKFYGLCIEKDVKFITLLVDPPDPEVRPLQDYLEEVGRTRENLFFFEIVNNSRTDMDVDRWDYLARDSMYTGLKSGFDYRRLLGHMRILLDDDGYRVIAFREKQSVDIDATYHLKYYLYRQVYMHLPTMTIELMIADAFEKVSGARIFKDEEPNQPYSVQDAIQEADNGEFRKYLQLTDSLYYTIMFSACEELRPGRELLKRIEKRNLYKLVGQSIPSNDSHFSKKKHILEKTCKKKLLEKARDGETPINGDNFIVKIFKTGFGTENDHPHKKINFYTKHRLKIDSAKAPKPLAENQCYKWQIRVFYIGNNNNEFLRAKKAFEGYCKHFGLSCGASLPELPSDIEPLSALIPTAGEAAEIRPVQADGLNN